MERHRDTDDNDVDDERRSAVGKHSDLLDGSSVHRVVASGCIVLCRREL
jgi:hypothetical protein